MANSDKNIKITPNISQTAQPNMVFTGQGAVPISIKVLDDSYGTVSFEGSAGQLFSVNNNLTTGVIWSVNDVSGIPQLDVNANGTIRIAPFGTTLYVGGVSGSAVTVTPATRASSGAGANLTLTAGSGVTSGAGGSLILQAGIQATTGGDGKVVVKQVTGQTGNLFEIQNSSGTALFNASSNANITIGTTGTNQRLIVQGGTNAQATEPAFVVKNAAGSNVLFVDTKRPEVAVGSALYFGQGNALTSYFTIDSQSGFSWVSNVTTAPDIDYVFAIGGSGNITKSGGTTTNIACLLLGQRFYPTSGSIAYAGLKCASTINQTGTASGVVRGVYINDTFTSLLGEYRAIETTRGNVVINTGVATSKGIVITAAASQTANLQEWQDSTGAVLGYVNSSGLLTGPINGLREKTTVSATSSTGTINYDYLTQSVLYYTANSTGNFTMNIRGNSTTTLNSIMGVGDTITLVFLSTNSTTGFYQTAFQIDGSAVTPKWQGGTAPSTGNANATDSYTYTIIKTASATYTVLASITKYA